MCLYAKDQVKRAKEDIVVWKLTFNGWAASQSNFKYSPGKKHRSFKGLVSLLWKFFFTRKKNKEINYGFHSWKMKPNNYDDFRQFIIPKGALYIEGTQYNNVPGFVSSSIIAPLSLA